MTLHMPSFDFDMSDLWPVELSFEVPRFVFDVSAVAPPIDFEVVAKVLAESARAASDDD